jgi:Protein of unknown function (DUF3224)
MTMAAKGTSMRATGPFDVQVIPQNEKFGDGISRLLLDKQYHGDLNGRSQGQMLAAGVAASSGAYVAIEAFAGTVAGKTGGFALHHTGIMTQGSPSLSILVVPDSGSGQLAGIRGTMAIHVAADGKHSYDFEYTLPR